MKFSLVENLAKLPLPPTAKWPQGYPDVTLHERDEALILLFAPRNVDYQTPHTQDELYVVVRGRGTLVVEGNEIPFETGDALFVAAGDAHRFVKFSDDFAAWVVFWGPHRERKP